MYKYLGLVCTSEVDINHQCHSMSVVDAKLFLELDVFHLNFVVVV